MAFAVPVATRVKNLPESYIFRDLNKLAAGLETEGMDVIRLGVGTPDLPTPAQITYAVQKSVANPRDSQGYPDDKHPYRALTELAGAISSKYTRKGVSVPPEHIVMDFGAKPITHNLVRLFPDPGDYVGVQSPAYPAFISAVLLTDAEPLTLACRKENKYLPDLSVLDAEDKNVKAIVLCYPNNPTGATAELREIYDICKKCEERDIVVIFDSAYSDFGYDGYQPPSALETGLPNVIEVDSFSKPYNMTGYRLGYAATLNKDLADLYVKLKSQIDSGVANFIQRGGVAALMDPAVEETRKMQMEVYEGRRNILYEGLQAAGIGCEKPKATPYFWCELPDKYANSREFSWDLAKKTGVIVTPGEAFGPEGEGHFRLTVFQPEDRLLEAVKRIGSYLN